MRTPDRRVLVREAAISTAVAGSLAAILVWLAPPGVDWAAHAYQRTFLLRHGFELWNNFWYAGRYSFITYSLIYYPLAALFGIRILAVASIATAALAFTFVVFRQWGPVSRASSRTFAVIWTGIVFSAAFPFALAVSFALLSIWALQQQRRGRFALGAALTLAASPLAFAMLAIVVAGVGVSRRTLRNVGVPVAVIAGGALVELLLYRLFGDGGRFPFATVQLLSAIAFCAVGLAATRRVPAARPLQGFFAIYLVAVVVAYLVPSSVGANIDRIRLAALPLALMVMALRHWRPLWLVVPVVALAAAWNVTPIASSWVQSASDAEHSQAYWQPAIGYLQQHLSPSFRVEAVDTIEHWPAAYLPDAGIPIVRGWYRQSDYPQNELLYDRSLGAGQYESWLRRLGVRYVVLSDAPPDYSARAEAKLIRSGRTALVPVFRSQHTTVYELPDASPLIVGPFPATVLWLWSSRLVASVDGPGSYLVKVRWSPYWRPSAGCVARAKDGMVRLSVHRAGLVELAFSVDVSGGLEALTGSAPAERCASTG